MSQTAAMFVAAYNRVDETTTFGARQYYMGVRDAMEAIFRACHAIDADDSYAAAREVLASLPYDEREALLSECERIWSERRSASIAKTLTAM